MGPGEHGCAGNFVLPWIVRVQGDLTINNPETGLPFDPANMVTNWPTIFFTQSDYVGLVFRLTIGAGPYFARYGKWRSGSSLLLHIGMGWFIAFLLFPVILGVRVTPPRNDNWAGGLGVSSASCCTRGVTICCPWLSHLLSAAPSAGWASPAPNA